MMKSIFLAVALLVVPEAAQAPAFTSTIDAFDGFATRSVSLPPDERVKAFRAEFDALVPGFYEPRNGTTDEKYNARVRAALEEYPERREKILETARNFAASYAAAKAGFRKVFPDYAPTMPIYLVHSLGEMDGGTRELHGKVVAIFGADVIARIHDAQTMTPFLDHELFHFHHARYFPDCEALWCSLWEEGLAVYVAARMNPGADDRMLLLHLPRPIRPEVDPQLQAAMCATRARMDSTSRADYSSFFTFGNAGNPDLKFPPRFGYYIGYLLAQRLGEGRSLDALAKLPPAKVRKLLDAALAAYRCPAGEPARRT